MPRQDPARGVPVRAEAAVKVPERIVVIEVRVNVVGCWAEKGKDEHAIPTMVKTPAIASSGVGNLGG